MSDQQLWRSVLWQAIMDATAYSVRGNGDSGGKITEIERDKARTWLLGDTPDFRVACELAGVDPRIAKKGAMRLKHDNWVRRSTEAYQHQNNERFFLKVAPTSH